MQDSYIQSSPSVTYDFPDITFDDFKDLGLKVHFPSKREARIQESIGETHYTQENFNGRPISVSHKTQKYGEEEQARLNDLTMEEIHSIRESMARQSKDKDKELRDYNVNTVLKTGALFGAAAIGLFGKELGIGAPLANVLYNVTLGYSGLLLIGQKNLSKSGLGKLGRFLLPKPHDTERLQRQATSNKDAHLQADKLLFMKNQGQEFTRHYVASTKYGPGLVKNYLTSEQAEQIDPAIINHKKQPVGTYEIKRPLVGELGFGLTFEDNGKVMTEKVTYLPETIEWAKQFKQESQENKM